MRGLASRPLLSVAGTTWTYGDAVLLGLHMGEWQALEERLARGLSLQAAGLSPDEEDVTAAIVAFRRDRRLHAAEDLREWLEARELRPHDLQAFAERTVLRTSAPPTPAPPVADGDVARALAAEAFCDGTLGRCAAALADRAVALAVTAPGETPAAASSLARLARAGPDRGLEPAELPERAARVLAADAALAAFREQAADEERLAERLRERRLLLTHVKLDALELDAEHAAREAALCVRLDGLGIQQVAVRAGKALETVEGELGELDPELLAGAAAGRPGELVGPLPAGDKWRVAIVRERHAPTLGDATVRARLTEELAQRALARKAAGKVSWHGEC